ncbi:hypothetical protein TSUD_294480 [Trifolium subterraneum]|uniref:Reverse transcriptase zinc-binding domain-containing protein n=1 Tax=Trifolium subterraneum TaxID=3900 RepID=A0A2Z6N4S9_TRISU|nr:hypothetical protein TSUD_294480 [Trifolium subterraneum]
MLVEGKSCWKDVLEAKYGKVGRGELKLKNINNVSFWWKDLVTLGEVRGVVGEWTQHVFTKLCSGGSTKFWTNAWVGGATLKEIFSRLFDMSTQASQTIKEVGS